MGDRLQVKLTILRLKHHKLGLSETIPDSTRELRGQRGITGGGSMSGRVEAVRAEETLLRLQVKKIPLLEYDNLPIR